MLPSGKGLSSPMGGNKAEDGPSEKELQDRVDGR